jgi:hypothetical protein
MTFVDFLNTVAKVAGLLFVVAIFSIENGQLRLKFANDAGKMDFKKGGAAK